MADQNSSTQVSFKDTLNLPRTDFPIRPQASIDDPALVARWEDTGLFEKAQQAHAGAEKYILHVGPPYANGPIHLGHAYNVTLKDIMTKAYRMSGYHVPVTPQWDCHGLPIEIKVAREHEQENLSPIELKRACRAYAQHWVDFQKEQLKRIGALMDWNHPVLTMSPHYEAQTVRAFGVLRERGFIERKNKTVSWCFSCKTVLATAEVEYKDRKDPSVYVLFPFIDQQKVAELLPEAENAPVSLLVWTTTPWTLPLNRAVLLKANTDYALVRFNDQLFIVGAATVPVLEKALQEKLEHKKLEVTRVFKGELLASLRVRHPFDTRISVPVIFDDSVGLDEGTAVVHIAPGCGQLDYELGVKNNLEIYSPVCDAGMYTSDIYPAELESKSITDGQWWVLAQLKDKGLLFHKASIHHSYPHCWRCHSGLIFRATRQWFFNLEHDNVKERALKAIENIKFMPEQGKNFLRATVENRWEWCLSRQRVWGVPIPALLCTSCGYAYSTPDFIDRVAAGIQNEGIEYWDRVSLKELGVDTLACPECKNTHFVKEHDILDVWFEAGVSHYVELYNNPKYSFPADLYLEGIDQHRGWFQSALLTALALEGEAPMKAIMTHGFTVDAKGQKMSKSLGNVVDPQEIINQLGTDGLRLWVASIGNDGDAIVSDVLLRNVAEVYRKIRNTLRFLLANLYDFDKEKDALAVDNLLMIDRAILAYLHEFNNTAIQDYRAGKFSSVFHALADFSTVYLSSWYLDIVKDRLYVEKADGHLRRSAQTACWYILDTITRLMAPILSFTAEQVSDLYQKDKAASIHLQLFSELSDVQYVLNQESHAGYKTSEWELLRELRPHVLKAIEIQREQGVIKHSLEARVTLFIDKSLKNFADYERFVDSLKTTGQTVEDFFKEFFIVSQVEVAQDSHGLQESGHKGLSVKVEHALGNKCPRCWAWDEITDARGLCRRCSNLLSSK